MARLCQSDCPSPIQPPYLSDLFLLPNMLPIWKETYQQCPRHLYFDEKTTCKEIICVLASDINIKTMSIRKFAMQSSLTSVGRSDRDSGIKGVQALWALINRLISRAKIPGVSRCLELSLEVVWFLIKYWNKYLLTIRTSSRGTSP